MAASITGLSAARIAVGLIRFVSASGGAVFLQHPNMHVGNYFGLISAEFLPKSNSEGIFMQGLSLA